MPVQALELLDGMLALDPAKRWSARQALDAEWLRYFVYLSIYFNVDWFLKSYCSELIKFI